MTKLKLILIGAGGHCRSCIDVIEQEGKFDILGVVKKAGQDTPTKILDYPVIGTDTDLSALKQECGHALVTVGQIKSSAIRFKLYTQLKELGFELPAIISPLAYVSRYAVIGAGTIVMHHAVVNANARVGTNCILNSKSLVEHDAVIGDGVHLSTGAVINGASSIGAGSFIGSGATVIQELTLPTQSFVRAGQLVVSEQDWRIQENG